MTLRSCDTQATSVLNNVVFFTHFIVAGLIGKTAQRQRHKLFLQVSTFFVFGLLWSDLHLDHVHRVCVASPSGPRNALGSQRLESTLQIEAVQVAGLALVVPPGAFVELCTVAGRSVPATEIVHVIVLVFGGELRSDVICQRITCGQTTVHT